MNWNLWNGCCQEVGYNPNIDVPKKTHIWYAYKGGQVYSCETSEDARKISNNIEKVCTNADEINAFTSEQRILRGKTITLFKITLAIEYGLSENHFQAIFEKVSQDVDYSNPEFIERVNDLYYWLSDNGFLKS